MGGSESPQVPKGTQLGKKWSGISTSRAKRNSVPIVDIGGLS